MKYARVMSRRTIFVCLLGLLSVFCVPPQAGMVQSRGPVLSGPAALFPRAPVAWLASMNGLLSQRVSQGFETGLPNLNCGPMPGRLDPVIFHLSQRYSPDSFAALDAQTQALEFRTAVVEAKRSVGELAQGLLERAQQDGLDEKASAQTAGQLFKLSSRYADYLAPERLQETREASTRLVSRAIELRAAALAGDVGPQADGADDPGVVNVQYAVTPALDLPDMKTGLLSRNERERAKVSVDINGLRKHDDESFSVAVEGEMGKTIFVMDDSGQIYATNYAIHHNSLLANSPAAAAGELKYADIMIAGAKKRVLVVSDRSGHYGPTPIFTKQMIMELKRKGLDLDDIYVSLTVLKGLPYQKAKDILPWMMKDDSKMTGFLKHLVAANRSTMDVKTIAAIKLFVSGADATAVTRLLKGSLISLDDLARAFIDLKKDYLLFRSDAEKIVDQISSTDGAADPSRLDALRAIFL